MPRVPIRGRWFLVAGAVHASFTDLALLADHIGLDIGAGLRGARALDITRAYVRAFFDQHLRGEPQALLDQPSPRYPRGHVLFSYRLARPGANVGSARRRSPSYPPPRLGGSGKKPLV